MLCNPCSPCRSSAVPLFHAIFTLSTFYRLINLQCRVDEHGMNPRSRPGLLQALTGSLPQPLQAVPALVGAAPEMDPTFFLFWLTNVSYMPSDSCRLEESTPPSSSMSYLFPSKIPSEGKGRTLCLRSMAHYGVFKSALPRTLGHFQSAIVFSFWLWAFFPLVQGFVFLCHPRYSLLAFIDTFSLLLVKQSRRTCIITFSALFYREFIDIGLYNSSLLFFPSSFFSCFVSHFPVTRYRRPSR
jgi:hypothetical protein